jgi:hypothetical protein
MRIWQHRMAAMVTCLWRREDNPVTIEETESMDAMEMLHLSEVRCLQRQTCPQDHLAISCGSPVWQAWETPNTANINADKHAAAGAEDAGWQGNCNIKVEVHHTGMLNVK